MSSKLRPNPTFQPFGVQDHGYTNSDSSRASLRELVAQSETESSNSVIVPVMVTEVTNVEEQLANMKATLERLAKENREKRLNQASKWADCYYDEETGKATIRILYQRLG